MRTAKTSLVLLFLLFQLPASAVREVPPPVSQLAGSYVGSVAGVSLQRLVLNADGSGIFDDVWFDAAGRYLTRYRVNVQSRSEWRIAMVLTPVEPGRKPLRLSGEADYSSMKLNISASERYRKRKLRLFRERTFQELLDFSRAYQQSQK